MSRYEVTQRQAHGATAFHLTDAERRAEAVLYPDLGNNCVEFRTTPDPGTSFFAEAGDGPIDLFVPPDSVEDLRHTPFHGGQPLLFPFPNRVRAGEFTFEGRAYKMERLLATGWDRGAGQAIHGLVADKPWTVEETRGDDGAARVRSSLQMDAFPDIVEQYPFPSRLTVTYHLRNGVLEMRTEITNTGASNMPMGFGMHPWFPTRLRPGDRLPGALADITPEQRGQAQVHVPADAFWELSQLMPTGTVIPVDSSPEEFDLREFRSLDGLALDNVFTRVRRDASGWSEGGLRDPESGLEMYLAADASFREWVLYAPLNRPVIALEPYTCTTDAVNLQPRGIDAGLIVLGPGQTWRGDVRFGLRRIQ